MPLISCSVQEPPIQSSSTSPVLPPPSQLPGVSGKPRTKYFAQLLTCEWDSVLFSHAFLVAPESPTPPSGHDVVSKAQASIHMNMEKDEWWLALVDVDMNPEVWGTREKLAGLSQPNHCRSASKTLNTFLREDSIL